MNETYESKKEVIGLCRNMLRFRLLDAVYLAMMIVPAAACLVLQIMTKPPAEGITISGARVFFTIPMPIQDLLITESQLHSVVVIFAVTGLCLYLTHGLSEHVERKRQHVAEWIVQSVESMVKDSMGDYFLGFAPFVTAILAISAFSSLLSLLGLYPPTSDLNITAGWAILVFILITYYKMKCGVGPYLKSLTEPVAFLTPINVIGEFATPVSMAFRHYGNVLSGTVISVLVAAGMQGLSSLLLGWLPGFLGSFPLFQIGIPAVLSVYFDIFSGLLQAYIFAMLTMMYVAGGFDMEGYFEKQKNKKKKSKNKRISEVKENV